MHLQLSDFIEAGIGIGITASCWRFRYKVISPAWYRMERSKFQEWVDCGIVMAFAWPVPFVLAILASNSLK